MEDAPVQLSGGRAVDPVAEALDHIVDIFGGDRLFDVVPVPDQFFPDAAIMAAELVRVFADIDHFKKFNDSAGHHAGDVALESVARVLRESFKRAGDVVCRFGGEEFAVLLPTTPAHGAMSRLKRTHELLHNMAISHPGTGGLLTLSCGVSTADTVEALENGTLESFLRDADHALYAAKRGGRNRSCHIKDLSEQPARRAKTELVS